MQRRGNGLRNAGSPAPGVKHASSTSARRDGLDYKEVASWNNIGPPYTIYPGQRIRLNPPVRIARAESAAPDASSDSQPALFPSPSAPPPSARTSPTPPEPDVRAMPFPP